MAEILESVTSPSEASENGLCTSTTTIHYLDPGHNWWIEETRVYLALIPMTDIFDMEGFGTASYALVNNGEHIELRAKTLSMASGLMDEMLALADTHMVGL